MVCHLILYHLCHWISVLTLCRWLANKGRENKALRSLQRLGYSSTTGDDVKILAHISLTLEEIKQETEGVTYLECFRKSNLRRTIISFAPLLIQQFTGESKSNSTRTVISNTLFQV